MGNRIYQHLVFKDWRGEQSSTFGGGGGGGVGGGGGGGGGGLIYSDKTAHTIRVERHLGKFVQSLNFISLSSSISTM